MGAGGGLGKSVYSTFVRFGCVGVYKAFFTVSTGMNHAAELQIRDGDLDATTLTSCGTDAGHRPAPRFCLCLGETAELACDALAASSP